jgi:transcriptional accessory protein Tex/SPT6
MLEEKFIFHFADIQTGTEKTFLDAQIKKLKLNEKQATKIKESWKSKKKISGRKMFYYKNISDFGLVNDEIEILIEDLDMKTEFDDAFIPLDNAKLKHVNSSY